MTQKVRPALAAAIGMATLGLVSGCSSDQIRPAQETHEAKTALQQEVPQETWPWRRTEYSPLLEGSPLAALANELSAAALIRSAVAQEQRAAMASRRAAEFERFPKLVPAVNVPVANSSSAEASNDPSIGITLEQTLYDFGQTRMRLERADSDIEAKRIEVWSERNDAVLNGLLAAVDAARLTQQLTMFHDLEKLLLKLEQRLEARTSGGVAGKGETLLITSALQKAQADTIRAQTDLRAAQSQLARLLPANQPAPALSLSAARKMCRRDLPQTTAPRVAMATVSLVQAETDSRLIRGKRFPRIVAQAGASMTTAGSPATSIGIQLDTTNMLGLGQGKVIESYDANVEARKRALAQANEDIATELDQHRMEFRGFLDSEQQLQTLVASKAETLALFDDQIAAGRLSLTDGIDLYREDADMRIQLLDIRANIVANCLQTAAILGTLAEYEVGDE